MEKINIIGAGIAGLSAAIALAQQNIASRLISLQPSERAQSVMAEGGINAALNLMGESDTVSEHYEDTMRGGVYLSDPNAVLGLTSHAPELVRWLSSIGVPFQMEGEAMIQRRFGGQKKKRTAYARSSTGKAIVSALIDECRKYEDAGLVERFSHHALIALYKVPVSPLQENPTTDLSAVSAESDPAAGLPRETLQDESLSSGAARALCTGKTHRTEQIADAEMNDARELVAGADVLDTYTGSICRMTGPVILCFGGCNGMLPGMTTGTTQNSGDGLALCLAEGIELSNLEFIQYHPTTAAITGKRMLISEAARGEGGRLYIERDGRPWYFMEELYPELGNLMPRDVVSREIMKVLSRDDCGDQVYLDLTGLPKDTWAHKLSDMREEIRHYLGLDPAKTPVPISPGIHYFMGGIRVDETHHTSLPGLYAAGECAAQYHGANRLGANSMLGALYGGRVAAMSVLRDVSMEPANASPFINASGDSMDSVGDGDLMEKADCVQIRMLGAAEKQELYVRPGFANREMEILMSGLGILRNAEDLERALGALDMLEAKSEAEIRRVVLGKAMLMAALLRKESRGAHTRTDYPEREDVYFQKTTVIRLQKETDGERCNPRICIRYEELPKRRDSV